MKKYFEILRQCTLFKNIESDNLFPLLGCLGAKVINYKKNETVISEGDNAQYIGIVLSGGVQIERTDYYGNRSIAAYAAPTELFAESFACAGINKMPVSVVATETSEVLLVDCKKIISTCNNTCTFHSRLIFNLLKIVATKNILLNQKSEIISKRTTREKLMAYLMFQAKKCGRRSFTIPYDRQALADYLGVDRSGLSVEIGKLREEGIIESDRSKFTLL